MKNTLYILRLTFTLLLICAIVAAALAGVNAFTGPRIAALKEEKTQQAIEAVLPGGGTLLDGFSDDTGLVQAVYTSEKGYAIQVVPTGFNGEITLMVGIIDGKISKFTVISQSETPSLGAVVAADNEKGQAFRGQFAGLSGELAVTKDGGSIDSITSATITSRAVTEGINAALACADKLG